MARSTNGMENFWSLLKRTISGTYVSVEPLHLFRYIDEQSFRFNLTTERILMITTASGWLCLRWWAAASHTKD
jgi:hypothetical protein